MSLTSTNKSLSLEKKLPLNSFEIEHFAALRERHS